MSPSALQLHLEDNVACLLRDHAAGECAILSSGPTAPLRVATPMGHKIALVDIARDAPVIKYGAPIGRATTVIAAGDHVHLHNLEGALR